MIFLSRNSVSPSLSSGLHETLSSSRISLLIESSARVTERYSPGRDLTSAGLSVSPDCITPSPFSSGRPPSNPVLLTSGRRRRLALLHLHHRRWTELSISDS